MILVTGATGKTGSRVVARLCAQGTPVRAQIRTPERAELVPEGAEIAMARFEDPVALDAAVSGCSRVYLVSPPGPGQRAQEGAVIDAVTRSGTGAHIVKIAAMGIGVPGGGRICEQHGAIRDDLKASGLPWTVLSLSQLMHNVFLYSAPVLDHGILPVPAGDARIAWVDVDDVAAVAVSVLTTPGHIGRTYDVTGPEALHHDELAAFLTTVTGRQVRYVDVPPEAAKSAMVVAGVPEWVAGGVVEVHQFYRQGGAENPTDTVPTMTGRRATTMAEFLARMAPRLVGTAEPRPVQAADPGR